MHSMCMCNADCLGNSCLLLVLSRSVTPRATGHAHGLRLGLVKHTHPNPPQGPGLASSALASAVLSGPGPLRRHRGCSTPSRAPASTGRPPGMNSERDKIPEAGSLECDGFSAPDFARQNRHSGYTPGDPVTGMSISLALYDTSTGCHTAVASVSAQFAQESGCSRERAAHITGSALSAL